MASGTITLNSTRDVLEGRIVWSSTSNGSSANSSNVYAEIQVRRNDGYTTKGTWIGSLNIAGNVQSFSNEGVSVGSSWVTMKSFTINNVAHSDNGKGSCYIYGKCNGPSATSMEGYYVEGSSTVTLDTIARYATITSFAVKSKTINTVVLQFTTNVTLDWVQYMFEGGSWADFNTDTNTIIGLSPNTTYKVRIQVRRKDSQLWTASSYVSFTTYDYAKLVSAPNVNIGSAHTITWSNPAGATTTLKLCKIDNTQIIDYGAVTGTSKSITPTAATIYALTPNSNSYKARYVITTTQNSKTYTNYKDFTFTVTNSNPTFSNFTYKDTNATTVALTGNNQILVKGYSNVSATISTANKAVAKNSATMKTYKLVIGTKSTNTKAYSSTTDVTLDTINSINSGTIIAYATDSRGNSTSVKKNATYKQYSDLGIKLFTATRSNNGVGQEVTLNFNGTYWANSFGAVTNAISSVKYFYKESSASSWISGATTLTYTVSNGSFSGSLPVQGDLGANGFDVSKSFNIRLQVTDKLVTKTYDITLGSGTPAIAIYKDNVAIGQKYDTNIDAKLQVGGGMNIPEGDMNNFQKSYQIGGEPVIRNTGGATIISGGGSVYIRPNGTTDTTGQVLIDTNGNITAPKLAGTATQVYGTLTNPPEFTSYFIPFYYNEESGNKVLRQNNGMHYNVIEGTSSVNGYGALVLGNAIATGTAKNKYGRLVLFSQDIGYIDLRATTTGSTYIQYLPNENGTIQLKPTGLYGNASGTSGTITLSETAANYNYLEIFYSANTSAGYASMKVSAPNGKTINLNHMGGQSSNYLECYSAQVAISGTSVTFKSGKSMSINNTGSSWGWGGFSNTNEIKIYKILGYK